jgi:hypothetical protein
MNRDVNRWVRACLVCRKRKTSRPHDAGHARSNPFAPYPWHTPSIDLVGPLNTTVSADKYLLTIIDTFTKWVVRDLFLAYSNITCSIQGLTQIPMTSLAGSEPLEYR